MASATNFMEYRPERTINTKSVHGHIDQDCLDLIDRIADQMLMPRTWVVSQILREWHERSELEAGERSWDDSCCETLARLGLDEVPEPLRMSASA